MTSREYGGFRSCHLLHNELHRRTNQEEYDLGAGQSHWSTGQHVITFLSSNKILQISHIKNQATLLSSEAIFIYHKVANKALWSLFLAQATATEPKVAKLHTNPVSHNEQSVRFSLELFAILPFPRHKAGLFLPGVCGFQRLSRIFPLIRAGFRSRFVHFKFDPLKIKATFRSCGSPFGLQLFLSTPIRPAHAATKYAADVFVSQLYPAMAFLMRKGIMARFGLVLAKVSTVDPCTAPLWSKWGFSDTRDYSDPQLHCFSGFVPPRWNVLMGHRNWKCGFSASMKGTNWVYYS